MVTAVSNARSMFIGDKAFYRRVAIVLIPIIIQNTVTNVVSLLDNVMVGRIGTIEMSSVAIVNQLLFIFMLCIFGGLAGPGIFTVQFYGARNDEGIRCCFRMKLYLGAVMLAVAYAVFLAIPDKLIAVYIAENTSPADAAATMEHALRYFRIMLVGLLPFTASQVYGSTLREVGETKLPMVASVSSIFVNLVFNYILIFGNDGLKFLPFGPMGVAGAAIATVIARFVELFIIFIAFGKSAQRFPFIKGLYDSFKIPKRLSKDIMKKDMPLLINEFLWSLGQATLLQCFSVRGLDVVAATNISTTAMNLFNVLFLSMGNAVAIMVGQSLGANKTEEAKKTAWRLILLSVGSCVVMGMLLAVSAPFIPHVYNTTEEIRYMATQFLWIVAGMMPFHAFTHACYFTLRSGGKVFLTMLFDSGFTWIVSCPAAFAIVHFTDLAIVPIYLCVQLLDIIKVVMGFFMVNSDVWLNNMVDEK